MCCRKLKVVFGKTHGWAPLHDMNLNLLHKLVLINRYPLYFKVLLLRYKLYAIRRHIKRTGVSASSNVIYYGKPIVSIAEGSKIEIGENCVICSDPEVTDLGVAHPVVMRTLRPGASIVIGRDTGISGGAICAAVRVKIGNECLIGANVVIADTDFHPLNPAGRRYSRNPLEISAEPVEIGDNVFIGTGTIILKGVTIGKNCVIGAGSVVTKNVPPDSIAAGNPAKVLRSL